MRLGSLSVILSEHLISGLVTGTAILVIASQLKHVFGMNLSKHNGSLQLIYVSMLKNVSRSIYSLSLFISSYFRFQIISDVFNNLSYTNYVALCTTMSVVILLLSYQEYFKVNKKSKKGAGRKCQSINFSVIISVVGSSWKKISPPYSNRIDTDCIGISTFQVFRFIKKVFAIYRGSHTNRVRSDILKFLLILFKRT